MARFIKRRIRRKGPQGAAIYIPEKDPQAARIRCLGFGEGGVEEFLPNSPDELKTRVESGGNNKIWVQVEGLSSVEILRVGEVTGIHPLFLEDILNTDHRPKADELDERLFVVLKVPSYANKVLSIEQVSIVLSQRFVVSFKETRSDLFSHVLDRFKGERGTNKLAAAGADYLFYTLLDTIVDTYFGVVEAVGFEIEEIHAELEKDASQDLLNRMGRLKNDMLFLRKVVVPARELLSQILRSPSEDITQKTALYLKDVHEHTIQLVDALDHYRELLTNAHQLFLGKVNQRLSEIMKIQTLFAAIFIPLNLIASIYGMNFEYLPGSTMDHGFVAIILAMVVVGAGLLLVFKRRGWL